MDTTNGAGTNELIQIWLCCNGAAWHAQRGSSFLGALQPSTVLMRCAGAGINPKITQIQAKLTLVPASSIRSSEAASRHSCQQWPHSTVQAAGRPCRAASALDTRASALVSWQRAAGTAARSRAIGRLMRV